MKLIAETERLILREMTQADFEGLYGLFSDPEVMRWIGEGGRTIGKDKTRESLERTMKSYRENGYGMWAVVSKDVGGFIGRVGIQLHPELQEIEIGWMLEKASWGKGFATEAATVALEYGFKSCGLERIIAVAYPENTASIWIMDEIGMTYIKTIDWKGEDIVYYEVKCN